jgi:hypothetical protein
MGEYYPGEITIGGKVPAALLEEFLGEVESTGALGGDYEGSPFDAKTAEELREALDQSGHLTIVNEEARFGQFEVLEGFLREHGIPFDRHSDARYEWDAENVMFRPGMRRPVEVASNSDGDDLMGVKKLRPVAKELARLATARMPKDKMLAAVRKASRRLNKLLPPEVEPLPALEIEG